MWAGEVRSVGSLSLYNKKKGEERSLEKTFLLITKNALGRGVKLAKDSPPTAEDGGDASLLP